MRLKAISGIIMTLLFICVLPLAFKAQPVAADAVDWWPMRGHDLNHTGYSTSTAPNTNNTIWNYTIWSFTGAQVYSSPAVVYGKVYVGSHDHKVYCLNASTGAQVWNYTTGGYVVSSPAVADGKVYVGSADYKVYCLNALTGAHIWNYTTGSSVWSSPAVSDGKVYVGLINGKVYCLDALTGVHVWNYTTGVEVVSSPAVADGKVYIGSFDFNVYCLNALTGAHIWNYTTGNLVYSSPAVADGKVYVGSFDFNVYAFGDIRDVAVIAVTTSKTGCVPMPTVGQGFPANVTVTVENQGDYTETFNVTAFANSSAIGEQQVTLNPGENKTLKFIWDTTGFSYGDYTIKAVADTVPGETDTIDNTYIDGVVRVVIPGDINGDGIVDIYDAMLLALRFGVLIVDRKWNPNADINGNAIIDIYDAIILAGHFGKES